MFAYHTPLLLNTVAYISLDQRCFLRQPHTIIKIKKIGIDKVMFGAYSNLPVVTSVPLRARIF